jgi:hypothetical protein
MEHSHLILLNLVWCTKKEYFHWALYDNNIFELEGLSKSNLLRKDI